MLGELTRAHWTEANYTDSSARRSRDALSEDDWFDARIKALEEELVDLVGIDPEQRLFFREHPLLAHVDGDADHRESRTLSGASLKHPELSVLDSELKVNHVVVIALQLGVDQGKLIIARLPGRVDGRHLLEVDGVRIPATTSSPVHSVEIRRRDS